MIGEHKWLPLSGLIEPFGINKKCSKGFNEGLITPRGTSLSNGFCPHFLVFIIFMNMQNNYMEDSGSATIK